MPHTIFGPYIDQEQNIIAFVVHDDKSFEIYKKTERSPFLSMENPETPYILWDPFIKRVVAFKMDEEERLYEINKFGTRDLYNTGININRHRHFNQHFNDEIESALNQEVWDIPDNIPPDTEIEAFIFPPEPINHSAEVPVDNPPLPTIHSLAQNAIEAVEAGLPSEVRDALIQVFLNSIGYLSQDNAINEIDILLCNREYNRDAILNIQALNEFWLSYRFIAYPDLPIANCQSYLLNLFIHLANNYREDAIDFYLRQLSTHTVSSFLMKDYPVRATLTDEDYVIRISELQATQNSNIDNFLDYPSHVDKNYMKRLLNLMIDNLEPRAFMNAYAPIMNYWQIAVYVDFMSWIWQLCDATMRFFTYLDIYALRLTETGQLISRFENLSQEIQQQIQETHGINNGFTNHIANQVWG